MCGYGKNAGKLIGGLSEKEQRLLAERYFRQALPLIAKERPRSVDVYCSGSFLAEDEVFPSVAQDVIRFVAGIGTVREITVESLPCFVSERAVRQLMRHARGRLVVIAMGYETSSDDIRRDVLCKDFRESDYVAAVEEMSCHTAAPKFFVLLGLPSVSPEEYTGDTVDAVRRCMALGAAAIEVQPTCVFDGTPLDAMYRQGLFTPPSFDLICKAVARIRACIGASPEFMGRLTVSTDILPTPKRDWLLGKERVRRYDLNVQRHWERCVLDSWPDTYWREGHDFRAAQIQELDSFLVAAMS